LLTICSYLVVIKHQMLEALSLTLWLLVSILLVTLTKSVKKTGKYVLLRCLLISHFQFSSGFHSVYEVQNMFSFDVHL
jgi:hypothetical protein